MGKNVNRPLGIVTCKFDKEFNESEAEKFISHWKGYGISCVLNNAKKRGLEDNHLILSSALEGLFDAFLVLHSKYKNDSIGELLQKKVIGISCRQCFYHQCVYFGFIPDKKRVFFPKKWVKWEDYFCHNSCFQNHDSFDLKTLVEKGCFSETEVLIINEILEGLDPQEIARKTGYVPRWIYQCLLKLNGRFSKGTEVNFKVPYKYGRIGPYSVARQLPFSLK